MKNYFTPRGLEKYRERIKTLEDRLEKLQSKVSGACETGGDVWHDNASYEYLCEDIRTTDKQLGQLYDELKSAEIVNYPSLVTYVCIGCEVEVEFNGTKEIYRILGHGEGNNHEEEICEVAYDSPLGQMLMCKKEGDIINFRGQEMKVARLKPIAVMKG